MFPERKKFEPIVAINTAYQSMRYSGLLPSFYLPPGLTLSRSLTRRIGSLSNETDRDHCAEIFVEILKFNLSQCFSSFHHCEYFVKVSAVTLSIACLCNRNALSQALLDPHFSTFQVPNYAITIDIHLPLDQLSFCIGVLARRHSQWRETPTAEKSVSLWLA